MRPRFPIGLLIVIVLLAITFFIGLLNDFQWEYLFSPLYWGVLIIVTFLLLIYNSVGSLVENDKFKELSPEDQLAFLEERNKPFYVRLYDSAFGKQNEGVEADIMMDHDYDGIHELDNKLPQWWLALFYFGCVFLVAYIFLYAFTNFAHPEAELERFNVEFDKEVADYMATVPQPKPDEMTFDPANIEEGKKLFANNCVTCHGPDGGAGGGMTGANLTDDYWRNINNEDLFHNIANVVYNGSEYDKTMRAFGQSEELLGKDIEKLAAYVTYINQDTDAADGKGPLGLVVEEWAKNPLPSDPNLVVKVQNEIGNPEDPEKVLLEEEAKE